jgi:Uma2 family endonuclease
MTTKLRFITADELLRMPREDGIRYELIRGVLVPKMPTGRPHSEAVLRTGSLLTVYSDANEYGIAYAGEPGYRLERDPDTVRAPDVAWFAPGHLPEGIQGYPELAPDLAVEVKSPSNSNPEMAAKAVMWLCDVVKLRLPAGLGRGPGADYRHHIPFRRYPGNPQR